MGTHLVLAAARSYQITPRLLPPSSSGCNIAVVPSPASRRCFSTPLPLPLQHTCGTWRTDTCYAAAPRGHVSARAAPSDPLRPDHEPDMQPVRRQSPVSLPLQRGNRSTQTDRVCVCVRESEIERERGERGRESERERESCNGQLALSALLAYLEGKMKLYRVLKNEPIKNRYISKSN